MFLFESLGLIGVYFINIKVHYLVLEHCRSTLMSFPVAHQSTPKGLWCTAVWSDDCLNVTMFGIYVDNVDTHTYISPWLIMNCFDTPVKTIFQSKCFLTCRTLSITIGYGRTFSRTPCISVKAIEAELVTDHLFEELLIKTGSLQSVRKIHVLSSFILWKMSYDKESSWKASGPHELPVYALQVLLQ